MLKRKNGFTLLELLVVVSIIGILIAMIAAGFSTAQKRSRDARRRADVKAAQNGFEQYYADNPAGYAAACATMAVDPYLPAGMPLDPQTGLAYSCTSDADEYCICAALEGLDTGNSNAGCGYVATNGDFFCTSNLQ